MKLFPLAALVLVPGLAFADSVDSGLVSDQASIQDQSVQLQAQLKSILTEMESNKLPGADRATVTTLLNSLGKLNDTDMKNVVTLLKSGNAGVATMTEVFKAQSNIQTGLTSLADRMAVEDSLETVPARIEALFERQTGNLRVTNSLAHDPNPGAAASSPSGQVAATEQQSVQDEVGQVLSLLQKQAVSQTAADLSKKLLEAANAPALLSDTASASKSIAAAQFPAAAKSEGNVLETLRRMVAVSEQSQTLAQRLEGLRASIQELVDDHAKLANQGAENATADQGHDSIRSQIGSVEASMGDRADSLRTRAEEISSAAAVDLAKADSELAKAQDQWHKASWDFKADTAKASLTDSQAALQKALDDVNAQIAQTSKQTDPASDDSTAAKMGELSKLDSEIAKLAADQAAASPTDPAAQAALSKETSDVQKDAAAVSPSAAAPLAQASEKTDDAASPSSSPDQKSSDSKDAASDIAAAASEVKSEMSAIASDAQKSENEEKALASLDKAADSVDSAESKADSGAPDATSQSVADLKAASQAVADSAAAAAALGNDSSSTPDAGKSGSDSDSQPNASQSSVAASQNPSSSSPDGSKGDQGDPGKAGSKNGTPSSSAQASLAEASQKLAEAQNDTVMGKKDEAKAAARNAKSAIEKAKQMLADAANHDPDDQEGGTTHGSDTSNLPNTLYHKIATFESEDVVAAPDAVGAKRTSTVKGFIDPARKGTLQSLQREGYPPEYGPMIQQYWRSLAAASSQP